MKLTQIRNATVLLEYGGVRFLIDPMLSPKGALPPCHSRIRPETRNPLHDLPGPAEDLVQVDAVIVTHLHPGHFDQWAAQLLHKETPVFAQNQRDAQVLQYYGFRQVRVLEEGTEYAGVTLIKIPGQQGNWDADTLRRLNSVCGVIFRSQEEPCLYATGDTVWFSGVERAVAEYRPEVILANAGANIGFQHRINMGEVDIWALHQSCPSAWIIATHMEDMNHWTLSKAALRAFALKNGFQHQLHIPENGESIWCYRDQHSRPHLQALPLTDA